MAQAQGIRLVVLLIPSRTLVENPKAPGGQEAERIAEETQLRNGIMAAFGEMGIEYVDALPLTQAKYQAATRENTAFYGGSHPFEAGYAAYAKSLLLYLEKAPAGPETH
ncbi:MAG: hypothetical protein EBV03_10270 [Proteobacteria bacterium]|nr:hypothetical protein [Pseudomonadota bacterium]